MAIRWGETLEKSLKFCIQPKRWLPLFVLDIVFVLVMFGMAYSNLGALAEIFSNLQTNPMALLPYTGLFLSFVAVFVVWSLLKLWVGGAILHQSWKEKDPIPKSFRVSFKRYPSLLVAGIIIGIISGLVNQIPLVGWLAGIVVALIFFFTYPGIIVRGMGFYRALTSSWDIFKKSPFRVFLMWLVIVIIASIIVGIFAVPALVFGFSAFISAAIASGGGAPAGVLAGALASLLSNIPALLTVIAVFFIGSSLTGVFSIKAMTEFYLQIKKKVF